MGTGDSVLLKKLKRNKTVKKTNDMNYIKWKLWGDTFGQVRSRDFAYFDAEISRTKSKFLENSKVLEIGFGNGNFLQYAKQKNWNVFGTEANKILVQIARENGFNVEYSKDISVFPNKTFDLIVAFDVIEHIPQDLLPQFFLDIKNKLKNSGYFIARFPNGDSPIGLRNQYGDVTHATVIGSGKAQYYGDISDMEVIFIGGQAEPLMGVGFLYFIHRIFALPIKKMINLFVRSLFSPRHNFPFCSSNMIAIYKPVKTSNGITIEKSFY